MARGNGEGSIYPHKRNGKKVGYRAAYFVHTANGPKRRYVSGKSREDVAAKLTKALGQRADGLVFDAGSLTVGEYLQRWLKDSVKGTVRHSTYEVHRHMIEPYIIPSLGCLKLKDLSPVHVRSLSRQAGLRTLRGHGQEDTQRLAQGAQAGGDGRPYSPQCVRGCEAAEGGA